MGIKPDSMEIKLDCAIRKSTEAALRKITEVKYGNNTGRSYTRPGAESGPFVASAYDSRRSRTIARKGTTAFVYSSEAKEIPEAVALNDLNGTEE
jgi:hypothetical protein